MSQDQLKRDEEARRSAKEAAIRRARIPTDKTIPEGVEDFIIGDGVKQYKDIREIERKLDAVMMRKRLDLLEPRPQTYDRTRTLRIWISNTAENQPWQGRGLDENAFDFNTGMEGTFKVKIEGRVLEDESVDDDTDEDEDEEDKDNSNARSEAENGDDAMDHDGAAKASKKATTAPMRPRPKMSHFFKLIVIEYDRNKNLQPENSGYIEWKKPEHLANTANLPAMADFDTLEFERKSDENINCTINLFRDETPERFALSKDLAEIIGLEEATRDRIVTGIWDYARAMNLQQDEEKRTITCDERLRAVFQTDTISFPQLTNLIFSHVSSLPPLKLPYTIRVDPDYHAAPSPTIYDIRVPAEDTLVARMVAVTRNNPTYATTLTQITELDKRLALIVQAINDSKAKHAFLTSMSKDPATFVRRWISSQKRDLEVIMGEATRGGGEDGLSEEFRRGGKDGVWGTESVRESVGLMVAKR
ncbi:SWI/SNF complex component snf12 [Xylographa opegraphella]|nr:SWI/SNF complex component snf12 [Xylographa opegraphella]